MEPIWRRVSRGLMLSIGLTFLTWIGPLSGMAITHYVDVNGVSPSSPFTNWATAANVIQDAVDSATAGDVILVTNGVYSSGGRLGRGTGVLTNRVVLDRVVTLQSVNSPRVTIIQG